MLERVGIDFSLSGGERSNFKIKIKVRNKERIRMQNVESREELGRRIRFANGLQKTDH
jgi:hypothetical protein